eukprot:UN18741
MGNEYLFLWYHLHILHQIWNNRSEFQMSLFHNRHHEYLSLYHIYLYQHF